MAVLRDRTLSLGKQTMVAITDILGRCEKGVILSVAFSMRKCHAYPHHVGTVFTRYYLTV